MKMGLVSFQGCLPSSSTQGAITSVMYNDDNDDDNGAAHLPCHHGVLDTKEREVVVKVQQKPTKAARLGCRLTKLPICKPAHPYLSSGLVMFRNFILVCR